MTTAKTKSGWPDLIEKLVIPVSTAATVTALGFFTSQYLSDQQALEARTQLYTQLMSQREQSDSAMRKDMFRTIFEGFLQRSDKSLDEQVLNLELLAYNFHDSLNLKPLFIYLSKRIAASNDRGKAGFMERVERVAYEVSHKQLLILEGAGQSFDRNVDLQELKSNGGYGIKFDPQTLTVEGIERDIRVVVLDVNPRTRELKLRLEVYARAQAEQNHAAPRVNEFWLSFFDFPMIDNTRLLNDQRVAVVLNSFDAHAADITVTSFPGAYASVKEKPYIQDLVNRLIDDGAAKDGAAPMQPVNPTYR
jgi:hypothetical protein